MKYIKTITSFILFFGAVASHSAFAQSVSTTQEADRFIKCPAITQNLSRGMTDSKTVPVGQISELQSFLKSYYNWTPKKMLNGTFDRITSNVVAGFQREQGITPTGSVGPQTRAAIFSECSSSGDSEENLSESPVYVPLPSNTQNINITPSNTNTINTVTTPTVQQNTNTTSFGDRVGSGSDSVDQVDFEFLTDPSSVLRGQSVSMKVSGKNLSSCSYVTGTDPTRNDFPIKKATTSYGFVASGTLQVVPLGRTTYTMNCITTNGRWYESTSSVTISESLIQNPATTTQSPKPSFNIEPSIFTARPGGNAKLKLIGKNLNSCKYILPTGSEINIPLIKSVSGTDTQANGDFTISNLSESIDYRVNCNSSVDTGILNKTHRIVVNPYDPKMDLYSNPQTVNSNESSEIKVSGKNLDKCSYTYRIPGKSIFDGGYVSNVNIPITKSLLPNGDYDSVGVFITDKLTSSREYFVTCTNPNGGIVNRSIEVKHNAKVVEQKITNKISSADVVKIEDDIVYILWTGSGPGTCSLYTFTSWGSGPFAKSHNDDFKVLLQSGLPAGGRFETPYVDTLNNPFPYRLQSFQLECGGAKAPFFAGYSQSEISNPEFNLSINPSTITKPYQRVDIKVEGQKLSKCEIGGGIYETINFPISLESPWSAPLGTSTGVTYRTPPDTTTFTVKCTYLKGKTATKTVTATLIPENTSTTSGGSVKGVSYDLRENCTIIENNMEIGATDLVTNNEVSKLQKFLAKRFGLDEIKFVTGYFGKNTQQYLSNFQMESGIKATGYLGDLTRQYIKNNCK